MKVSLIFFSSFNKKVYKRKSILLFLVSIKMIATPVTNSVTLTLEEPKENIYLSYIFLSTCLLRLYIKMNGCEFDSHSGTVIYIF